jgi:glycosyltransferase involved in cell wall biosynthesis
MERLTIGMSTYREYDALWFTITNILIYHPEIRDHIDFVVVDNDPKHPEGRAIKQFVESSHVKGKYIAYSDKVGTAAPRDAAVSASENPWVLMIDAHVSFAAGSLAWLLDYIQCCEGGDLYHGLLVDESGRPTASHMNPEWRDYMYGTWGLVDDPKGIFEIPMHGMGIYLLNKTYWPWYNERFKGFGGEEGYIHRKYRNQGGRVLCLADVRWAHRFRTIGPRYPNYLEDRFSNYLIGFSEVGLDLGPVIEQFRDHLKPGTLFKLLEESGVQPEQIYVGV